MLIGIRYLQSPLSDRKHGLHIKWIIHMLQMAVVKLLPVYYRSDSADVNCKPTFIGFKKDFVLLCINPYPFFIPRKAITHKVNRQII